MTNTKQRNIIARHSARFCDSCLPWKQN